METDWSIFSLKELRQLHERADRELKAALLGGASWSEVQDKRRLVTELSIHLHKRIYPTGSGSPADTPIRGEDK